MGFRALSDFLELPRCRWSGDGSLRGPAASHATESDTTAIMAPHDPVLAGE